MASENEDFIAQTNKRFHAWKSAWEDAFREYRSDIEMVYGDQWDPAVRNARESSNQPALSFPFLHTFVLKVSNAAREEHQQPRVDAIGEGASQEIAEVYEGLFRHVQAASAADVAADTALECACAGGIGFSEFVTEYVNDEIDPNNPAAAFDQEPRIKRILDPTTVIYDPNCKEADFSDGEGHFKLFSVTKEAFKERFGIEPASEWPDDRTKADWASADGDEILLAEYTYVKKDFRTWVLLSDGRAGYKDEIEETPGVSVLNTREIADRSLTKCILDGSRVLEKTPWVGKYLPIVPNLGQEVVIDGRKKYLSVIRFAKDGQKLVNTCSSGVANMLQITSRAPWLGPKGSMKDKRWDDNSKNYSKLEYEAYDEEGRPLPAPTRNAFEAPIEALSKAALIYSDAARKSIGYNDSVINPSQQDLSGVAVERRTEQADLTNSHFQSNQRRSQWHAGRVLLDLILKMFDRPRAARILKADGTVSMQAITMAIGGEIAPQVAGYEGKPHIQIDLGKYDVTMATGKSYTSRLEETTALLGQMFQANPELFMLYGDLFFKMLGQQELQARAELTLPPQVQQAKASAEQGLTPQAQQLLAQSEAKSQQLQQALQALQGALQKLLMEKQAKIIETDGKIQITQMQNASREKIAGLQSDTDIIVQDKKHHHEATKTLLENERDAIKHMLDMAHEAALTPDPNLVMASKLAPKGTTVQ